MSSISNSIKNKSKEELDKIYGYNDTVFSSSPLEIKGEIECTKQCNGIWVAKCNYENKSVIQTLSIGGQSKDIAIYRLKRFIGHIK